MTMDNYAKFKTMLSDAAQAFLAIKPHEVIRVVSHLDADGLSSAAVISKMLNRQNRRYTLSTVPQLDEEIIKQLAREPYSVYFFTDLGSGQFSYLKEYLASKHVFILDHHMLQEEREAPHIVHVNPHLCGINGSVEISGAGVTYLFAREVNPENKDAAHIAIIGAMGDMQERKGFEQLNAEILEDAKASGKLKVITGLRIFGAQTKPLHKLLEHSTEHPIPGITGDERAAIAFLRHLGISSGGGWRTLVTLNEEELQKLATAVVLKRLDEDQPEAILGPIYILINEAKESPLRDAKEFSTVLNACGRLGKSSLGIGACLGNPRIKEKALKAMAAYRREISQALRWYKEEKHNVMRGDGYLIINAQDNIMPTIIGTLASIVSHSSELREGTLILSMAQMAGGKTKASMRVAGSRNGLNLRELMVHMAAAADGQAGGHHQAAGAILSTEKEEAFLEEAKRVLEMQAMEEKIT
jgi:single-stranded-DNA-specific exonuclease